MSSSISRFQDLSGQKIGRWTVRHLTRITDNGDARFLCQCDCGTERELFGFMLRGKKTQSCGCYARELRTKKWSPVDCGDHFKIPLSQGKFAKIDKEDYLKIQNLSWCINPQGYAIARPRGVGKQRLINMQQVILGIIKGKEIDHINHDKTDNRKQNIRFCTRQQNTWNTSKSKGKSSLYRGIHWVHEKKRWYVRIRCNHKESFLGYYRDIKEAVEARRAMARKLYGEFCNE
jgi:hypothetical protein